MSSTKKYSKYLIGIVTVLAISILCTFLFSGPTNSINDVVLNIIYGIIIGLSIAIGCQLLSNYFFSSNEWQKQPVKGFTKVIIVITSFIIINVTLINILWFGITQDIPFAKVLNLRFVRSTIVIEFIIALTIYLITLAKHFSVHLNKYYIKLAATESQLVRHQYETLKSQVNPHFLFNTLNTLSGLIYKDVDKADQFIHHFSQIYRYVLDVQHEEVVPITQELDFIDHYLFLSNIRFNNAIQAKIQLTNTKQFIVPMALQLVFENVLKHNQFNIETPMQITLSEEDGFLKITNPIRPKEQKENSSKLGIKNLQGRYSLLTDKEIQIEKSETHFIVYLPILKNI
ncbi:MAG: histidine kinase [Crocinitomicaceae bacterium]|nr:histidine kinase [Crocinitomicaceae bacterium]